MRGTWVFAAAIALPFAGLSLASGCSSSRGSPPPGSDASDDVTTADVATPGDAGPDINQPADVYPADHQAIPQIDYNGGPILQNPRLVTITFVGEVHRDGFRSFVHAIATPTNQWWMETAEGFCLPDAGPCVGPGTVNAPDGEAWLPDGSTLDAGDGFLDVELPYDFPSDTVTDSQIPTWLGTHIANGDFPQPDSQTVYVIFFPQTTTITDQDGPSCITFGAYHNAGMANGRLTPYAVIPYCDYGGGDTANYQFTQVAASHEIVESTTDPFPQPPNTAFYLETNDAWEGALSLGGGECGDMCEGLLNEQWPYDGYTYQRIWSNQAAAQSMQPCQPSTSPNPYFGAALRAPTTSVSGHPSAGYIVAKRGQDTVGIADVFSQAPLGHDFLLYAGVNKGSATTSPTDLGPPDDNITITFSQQQVHNGDGVFVTFSVPSTALPSATVGPLRVVLRAVYTDPTTGSDYNDWPVMVWVE
jgi:hypothetical protein